MGIKRLIEVNKKIIATYNSCDMTTFTDTVNQFLDSPDKEAIFTKKWYVWNIIRPKDYYKCMAEYVITSINYALNPDKIRPAECDGSYCQCIGITDQTETLVDYWMRHAEYIIKMILRTTKDPAIQKSFIWKIMKKIPLITVDTIQYANPEKLHNLLTGDKKIICDDYMRPFIDVVTEYREHLKAYEAIAEEDL